MTVIPHILLVDQNAEQLQLLNDHLLGAGYRVLTATSGEEALKILEQQPIELLLCDAKTGSRRGLTLSEQVQRDYPNIARILILSQSILPDALEATSQGAFGFISPPFDKPHILDTVRAALDTARQRRDQRWRDEIVGRTPLMEQLLDQSRRVAASDVSLVISGAQGSGKTLLAHAIHRASRRARAPFEILDCSELPEQMLESELFGYSRGAFSGVGSSDQPGLLSRTRGGTLVLKEIGDLPQSLQHKLLQTLRSTRSKARDADHADTLDTRIIATTTRNLEHAMLSGEFLDELFYQLNVVSLEVPSLQERAEDIPLLARHFLEQEAIKQHRRVRNLSPGAIHLLGLSAWPGNIRQLQTVIEHAVAGSTSPVISEALVAEELNTQPRVIPSFNEARAEFERRYLIKLLQITEGNVTHAARIAERNRTDLYKLLGKHDLDPSRFKVRRRRQRKSSPAASSSRSGTDG